MRRGMEEDAQKQFNMELERQQTRRWKVGDVYAPHDLSSVEMQKWKWPIKLGSVLEGKGKRRKWGDTFDVLGVDPVGEYKVSYCLPDATGYLDGLWGLGSGFPGRRTRS